MNKLNKVQILEPWQYDQLFPILKDAFRVLHISYQQLFPKMFIKPYARPPQVIKWQLENLITDDLVKITMNVPKLFEYRIQKQQEDFETNAKIDIAVLYSLKFGDNSKDLKIECKRLDNLQYFIEDGIFGFITNKYAKKLPLAGMLAYNITGVIQQNIDVLNEKIQQKISFADILKSFNIIQDYPSTYVSRHQREFNSCIDLYYLVLDFKDVIR